MTNASDFWSAHLTAIEQRGISIAEYAREHDLSAQSLYGWRNRLRQSAPSERRVRFTEVVVAETAVPARVLLRVGEAVVEFEQLPEAGWLAEVLSTATTRPAR